MASKTKKQIESLIEIDRLKKGYVLGGVMLLCLPVGIFAFILSISNGSTLNASLFLAAIPLFFGLAALYDVKVWRPNKIASLEAIYNGKQKKNIKRRKNQIGKIRNPYKITISKEFQAGLFVVIFMIVGLIVGFILF